MNYGHESFEELIQNQAWSPSFYEIDATGEEILVVSLTTGMNTDVCNYRFGSILAMSRFDVQLSIGLSSIVLILCIFFDHKMFAIIFDETFARVIGTNVKFYKMLLAFLTAITIAWGMRWMGVMLCSSLIVFPTLTGMRVCKTFKWGVIHAPLISIFSFFIDIVISYIYATLTGVSVVAVNIVVFLLYSVLGYLKRKGI